MCVKVVILLVVILSNFSRPREILARIEEHCLSKEEILIFWTRNKTERRILLCDLGC